MNITFDTVIYIISIIITIHIIIIFHSSALIYMIFRMFFISLLNLYLWRRYKLIELIYSI